MADSLPVVTLTTGYDNWTTNTAAEIFALDGDDEVVVNPGGAGSIVHGEAGDDYLNGQGASTLIGGVGNDRYIVGGSDVVVVELAGEGYDGVAVTDSYVLPDYVEELSIGSFADSVVTAIGNAEGNVIQAGGGSAVGFSIDGGAGDDYIEVYQAYDDTLIGGSGNDTLRAQEGKDLLSGGDGADWLEGYWGDDTVYGGEGADEVSGDAGNDVLHGEGGNDTVYAGYGNDTVVGGDGNDSIYGFSGDDDLTGGAGADVIDASDGNDRAFGGAENDMVKGGSGNDELGGGSGNDTVVGGRGVDTLYGGDGDDILRGEQGANLLEGGGGSDTFAFTTYLAGGINTIKDFVSGQDQISIVLGLTNLKAGGALWAERLVVGSAADDANDRFIFDDATGNLYYDADGAGVKAQVHFATLTGVSSLQASDIVIV